LPDKKIIILIAGPTGVGKSAVGLALAEKTRGEIINCDSMQVYKGFDIGTDKPGTEDRRKVPHHLLDIIDASTQFTAADFAGLALAAVTAIGHRGGLPLIVGGTGMYLDAVLRGYRLLEVPENSGLRWELAAFSLENLAARLKGSNPKLHNTTDLLDRERLMRAIEIAESGREREQPPSLLPKIEPVVFGIRLEREILRQRITKRLRERLNRGMIEEVKELVKKGAPFETLEFYGLEYRFVAKFLKGELNRNDMSQKLNSAIFQFAKRQETWFRRMERQGVLIHWVDGNADPAASILKKLKG